MCFDLYCFCLYLCILSYIINKLMKYMNKMYVSWLICQFNNFVSNWDWIVVKTTQQYWRALLSPADITLIVEVSVLPIIISPPKIFIDKKSKPLMLRRQSLKSSKQEKHSKNFLPKILFLRNQGNIKYDVKLIFLQEFFKRNWLFSLLIHP